MHGHGKAPGWKAGAVVAAAALALGCGGGGGGGDAPPAVDITGTWTGTLSSNGSGTSSFQLEAEQSGADVTGTFTGGGGGGTLTGTVSGRSLELNGRLTTDECSGTLSGSGEVSSDGDAITFTYHASLTCGGTPVQDSGSASLTREPSPATPTTVGVGPQIFCDELAACSSTPVSDADLQLCRQLAVTALQVVPDPEYFGSCMAGLSCDQLEDAAAVQACVDIDGGATACSGSTLHACAGTGRCVDESCPALCGLVGATFDHCGFDSTKGHDVCWCG